jgi:cytoskeletal protein CcmA (bactofilin family)
MWKRDEAVRPTQHPTPPVPPAPVNTASTPEPVMTRTPEASRYPERDTVNIGKSVIIKGDLSGSEDLTIEGEVEGKIELRENVLSIGPNGRIKEQVFAKAVVVQGEVQGNITATERVDIRDAGIVDGDLSAPRVAIADGAHFRGSIDMQKQTGKPADVKADAKVEHKAEAKPSTPAIGPNGAAHAPVAASAVR